MKFCRSIAAMIQERLSVAILGSALLWAIERMVDGVVGELLRIATDVIRVVLHFTDLLNWIRF